MRKRIRRRCACGCEEITNYGKMYVNHHHLRGKKLSADHILKLSETKKGNTYTLGHKHSTETIKKMSEAKKGKRLSVETKAKISKTLQGRKLSAKHKLNISLARIKDDPNYQYCEVWHDKEYLKDIRKDYCENVDCKENNSFLCNHHIHLDKKKCAPNEIMTLCDSCHRILHNRLRQGKSPADPKDYIIINRPDHVSYIHKQTHKIIRINKIITRQLKRR